MDSSGLSDAEALAVIAQVCEDEIAIDRERIAAVFDEDTTLRGYAACMSLPTVDLTERLFLGLAAQGWLVRSLRLEECAPDHGTPPSRQAPACQAPACLVQVRTPGAPLDAAFTAPIAVVAQIMFDRVARGVRATLPDAATDRVLNAAKLLCVGYATAPEEHVTRASARVAALLAGGRPPTSQGPDSRRPAVAAYPAKATFLAMLADGYDCMPEEFEAGAFGEAPGAYPVACDSILERAAAAPFGEDRLAPTSVVRYVHELTRLYHEELREARLRAWARLAGHLDESEWASLWLQHPSCDATTGLCHVWERAHRDRDPTQ